MQIERRIFHFRFSRYRLPQRYENDMSRHQKDGTQGIAVRLKKDWIENGGAYLLALAVLAYYLLFHYKPMVGAVIAFKDFSSSKGIWGSKWIGVRYFSEFFTSYYFLRLVKNTLVITLCALVIGVTIGAVIMVVGYSLGRAFIYSTPEYALLKLPFQIAQAVVGAVVGWLLCWKCKIAELYEKRFGIMS